MIANILLSMNTAPMPAVSVSTTAQVKNSAGIIFIVLSFTFLGLF